MKKKGRLSSDSLPCINCPKLLDTSIFLLVRVSSEKFMLQNHQQLTQAWFDQQENYSFDPRCCSLCTLLAQVSAAFDLKAISSKPSGSNSQPI